MKNPSTRTYIFLVFLILVMLVGWKYCSDHQSSTPAGNAPVKSSTGNKPDH